MIEVLITFEGGWQKLQKVNCSNYEKAKSRIINSYLHRKIINMEFMGKV